MKSKILFFLFAVSLFTQNLFSQATTPQGFSYQAIVRDANGAVLTNQATIFYFDIREGTPQGNSVYSESQEVTTNEFGLANLSVGQGKPAGSARFSEVDWAVSTKFLTISLDPGSGRITNLGTSQLMSVPYALFAAKAGSCTGDNNADDDVTVTMSAGGQINGTFANLQIAQQGAFVGQVLKWDGTKWAPGDDEKGKDGNGPDFAPGQVPVGTILPWASNLTTPPTGYLFCNGSIVTSTQYPDLFNAIGTTWGAGLSTSNSDFHLPDLRGRFMRGISGTTTNDPDKNSRAASNIGGLTGNNIGSLQTDELKSHQHTVTGAHGTTGIGYGPYYLTGSLAGGADNRNVSSTGGTETRPKNVNVNYIIKW